MMRIKDSTGKVTEIRLLTNTEGSWIDETESIIDEMPYDYETELYYFDGDINDIISWCTGDWEKFKTDWDLDYIAEYGEDAIKEDRCCQIEEVKIYTADKETGTIIDEFETIIDAQGAISMYEKHDKAEGNYVENFYDIVDKDHHSLI